MCRIFAGRGTANFKAKFPVLQELFAKNHRMYKDDKSLNSGTGQIPMHWLNRVPLEEWGGSISSPPLIYETTGPILKKSSGI